MEDELILEAGNKDALNKLIDNELKRGFLIAGGIEEREDGIMSQRMTLAGTIDNEVTVGGLIQLVIMVIVWVSIVIYLL